MEPMSWHHQAVDEVGDGLTVVGHAPDGVIEALEMPEHPWLFAVQWHPEITAAHDPVQQRLFEGLVQAARGET
jgi:putative glutamine amidotransferase